MISPFLLIEGEDRIEFSYYARLWFDANGIDVGIFSFSSNDEDEIDVIIKEPNCPARWYRDADRNLVISVIIDCQASIIAGIENYIDGLYDETPRIKITHCV